MPDKISGLPSASGMNNPDVIPIVQSGSNKKIAFGTFVDNINLDQNQVTNLVTDLADKSDVGHTHSATAIVSGTMDTARLGSGTANNTSYLRGDQVWTVIPTTTAGGSSGQLQYNNGGSLGGASGFSYSGGNINATGNLNFTTGSITENGSKVFDVPNYKIYGSTHSLAIDMSGSAVDFPLGLSSSAGVFNTGLVGPVLIAKASGKIQDWRNSTNTVVGYINDTGTLSCSGSLFVSGTNILNNIQSVSASLNNTISSLTLSGGGATTAYVNSTVLTTSIALHNTDVTNSAALNNSLIVGLNTWAARTASQNVDMDGNSITNCTGINVQGLLDGLGVVYLHQNRLLYDEDSNVIVNWSKDQSLGGILTFDRGNDTATLGMSLTLTDAPIYCNALNTQISNQYFAVIGQTNKASLKADNLSTNRIIQLPDIAGNLASEVYADSSSSTVSIAINNRLTPTFSTSSVIASTITTANLRATATINAGTATINNLRQTNVVPRSTTTTSTGSVSTEIINYDVFSITALSQTCTINPAVAGNNGQKVLFAVRDNGSSRSVIFQSPSVRAFGGRTLTQTTTISKFSYYGIVYNAANTCWDFIGSTTEN